MTERDLMDVLRTVVDAFDATHAEMAPRERLRAALRVAINGWLDRTDMDTRDPTNAAYGGVILDELMP